MANSRGKHRHHHRRHVALSFLSNLLVHILTMFNRISTSTSQLVHRLQHRNLKLDDLTWCCLYLAVRLRRFDNYCNRCYQQIEWTSVLLGGLLLMAFYCLLWPGCLGSFMLFFKFILLAIIGYFWLRL